MKFYFMLFLSSILVLGCSQNITRSLYKSIIITSDKEIISDLEGLETNLLKHLNNPSIQNFSIEDIFEGTWLSSIKTSHLFDKSISVEIKD